MQDPVSRPRKFLSSLGQNGLKNGRLGKVLLLFWQLRGLKIPVRHIKVRLLPIQ